MHAMVQEIARAAQFYGPKRPSGSEMKYLRCTYQEFDRKLSFILDWMLCEQAVVERRNYRLLLWNTSLCEYVYLWESKLDNGVVAVSSSIFR